MAFFSQHLFLLSYYSNGLNFCKIKFWDISPVSSLISKIKIDNYQVTHYSIFNNTGFLFKIDHFTPLTCFLISIKFFFVFIHQLIIPNIKILHYEIEGCVRYNLEFLLFKIHLKKSTNSYQPHWDNLKESNSSLKYSFLWVTLPKMLYDT